MTDPSGRIPSPRPRFGEVLRTAAWFGLITGLGSVGLVAIGKFVLHQVTLTSPQVVWVAPLTFLLLAPPAALLLAGLGRLLPRFFGAGGIAFTLAAAGATYGLLTWGKELHDVSVAILALGIGVQFGTFARAKPASFRRMVGRTMPILVAVPVLLAVVVNAGGALLERRAVARLGAARDGAPNVLLVILDTVRDPSTSLDDPGRPTTPELARFAGNAITFDRAISPTSWTLASHSSMFTGHPIDELSAGWDEPLDGTWPTLAEYLRGHGYRTGAVVGNVFYCNSEWGLDRGFIHYEDYANSLGHGLLSTSIGLRLVKKLESAGYDRNFWFHHINGRRIAADVRRDIVRWIDRDKDRPWFAFVNFYDAHNPYVAPAGFLERIRAAGRTGRQPVKRLVGDSLHDVPADRRTETIERLDRYEAAILYLDRQIGLMLDDMESRGLLDNTLVIVTADHGEEFQGHGYNWHGNTVNMPAIHVPLVVRLPDGSRTGQRIDVPVSLTDLPATVVDVLGLGDGSPFPGRSFLALDDSTARPVLADVTLDDRAATPPVDAYRSVVDDHLHYIVDSDHEEQLYDYTRDPFEQVNLARDDSTRLAPYRALLAAGLATNRR